ncbi:MBL fold metallo-hydrolase [Dinoroseobacter sp. PD6]|uniref:MBL fold metallo-hydrolase n=1 Tax=Dinoroseobacter sp. PD6 TaxID=3028384 RepID=UPI00237BC22A|nr:MBL fold metallo-hydrolase [Dinoroseobacter sp. PD6]MDD9717565.1 MBL fold metallo-hydrolase [Dinoroseobacter sp. PD6]
MTTFTRRQALAASAAFPLAAAAAGPSLATPEMKGATTPTHNRVPLGAFEVTTLLAGSAVRDEIQTIFGMNVPPEEFAAVSAENFIPADRAQFFFTPTVVNTGSELVLFDTGLNPEGITSALGAAGYTPDQVDVVVLTHMHGDHIGGLMSGDDPTFANARYVTGAAEHNHWSSAGNERFDTNVAPLNDRFTFLDDGGSPASGITALAAFGHTPGHMTYRIESEGQAIMLIADLANHPIWSLERPDWEVRFDMDKAAAAAARRAVLGQIADERIPMIGYHMPFPGIGFVETRGDGFRYVPHSYQLLL